MTDIKQKLIDDRKKISITHLIEDYGFNPYLGVICETEEETYKRYWAQKRTDEQNISELKSSLLISYITTNETIKTRIINFILMMISNYMSESGVDIKDKRILDKISDTIDEKITNSIEETLHIGLLDSYIKTYPVRRQLVSEIIKDPFALSSVLRVLTTRLVRLDNDMKNQPNYIRIKRILSDVFLQNIFFPLTLTRGKRYDVNHEMEKSSYKIRGKNTDYLTQIGITDMIDKELSRNKTTNLTINPDKDDLYHPSKDSCRQPHNGLYGFRLRENKDNAYGTLQCGISGSVNLYLSGFLMSIGRHRYCDKKKLEGYTKKPVNEFKTSDIKEFSLRNDDIESDVKNVLLVSIMSLLGDGGHGIRECVFGFIFLTTLLYYILKQLEIEISKLNDNFVFACDEIIKDKKKFVILNKIHERLILYTDAKITQDDKYIIFFQVLVFANNWIPFITQCYNDFKNDNFMSFDEKELIDFQTTIINEHLEKEKYEQLDFKKDGKLIVEEIKNNYIFPNLDNFMLYYINNKYGNDSKEIKKIVFFFQLFFILENERYTKPVIFNDFEYTKKIIRYLELDEKKISDRIDKHISTKHRKDSTTIPYAFNNKKKKKSKKCKKRSSKKRSNKKRSSKKRTKRSNKK